jgi:hypothetical protein
MNLQELKEQVIDIIATSFAEGGMFEVVNSQGGVEDTLTLQQVDDLVQFVDTRQDLHNLVLVDWMMGDVYVDLEDFISEFV